MRQFKEGEMYADKKGAELYITKTMYYTQFCDAVYYESDQKTDGLIDKNGRYFLSSSIYANELKRII